MTDTHPKPNFDEKVNPPPAAAATSSTTPHCPLTGTQLYFKTKGINGEEKTLSYTVGKYLGKGAFAKCYELIDKENQIFAAKITEKASLTKANAITKLRDEINHHRLLKHKHVVRFCKYIENEKFYCFILEHCNHKDLRSLLRKRKTLTEMECRYYLLQILDGVEYIHSQNILHRDLKLDNILLKNMHIKIADFGLSLTLDPNQERKRPTVAGTPNYIAPEVLSLSGQSFPSDVWAIGVIMYTLLYGKAPFESESREATYAKIQENNYSFPVTFSVSNKAKDLITKLLSPSPELRPTIPEIRSHPFFKQPTPNYLPETALCKVPDNIALSDQQDLTSPSNKLLPQSSRKALRPITNTTDPSKKPDRAATDPAPTLITSPPGSPTVVLKLVTPSRNPPPPHDDNDKENENPTKNSNNKKRKLQDCNNKEPNETEKTFISPPRKRKCIFTMAEEKDSLLKIQDILTKFLNDKHDLNPSVLSVPPEVNQGDDMIDLCWVSKWIDYSPKYGLGYILRDGTVGASFVDKSSIWLTVDQKIYYLDAFETIRTVENKESSMDAVIKKRVTLLDYFNTYLSRTNSSSGLDISPPQSVQANGESTGIYLRRWIRLNDAIIFLLSNNTIQINYVHEHTKFIVTPHPTLSDQMIVLLVSSSGQRSLFNLISSNHHKKTEITENVRYLNTVFSSHFGIKS